MTSIKVLKSTSKKSTKLAAKISVKVPEKHLIGPEDILEVLDSSIIIAVDLKRQSTEFYSNVEISDGQKFFPYNVLSRLIIGWESIEFVSSFDMKVSAGSVLPEITVRFVEKMTPEDIKNLDSEVNKRIMLQIDKLRQYPFVKIESPLLM